MKKILIVGGNGYIGSRLRNIRISYGETVFSMGQNIDGNYPEIIEIELTKYKEINYGILDNVDFLIYTAAISSPDICEKQTELSNLINIEATEYFIRQSIDRGCRVIFFSSDAVFGNDQSAVFTEKSSHNPISQYGRMKAEIEKKFFEEPFFKALRLSYVFSPNDKFTKYYLDCLKNGNEAVIYHPFYRSVVCLHELFDIINAVIEKWDDIKTNVINACGNDLISRIQMADTVNRIFGIKNTYKIVPMEGEFLHIRPEITEMKSLYLPNLIENYYENFYCKAAKEFKLEGRETK